MHLLIFWLSTQNSRRFPVNSLVWFLDKSNKQISCFSTFNETIVYYQENNVKNIEYVLKSQINFKNRMKS